MASEQDLLAKYNINPEDIPSGEEMMQYNKPLEKVEKFKGMVFFDKQTKKPCGLVITEKEHKFLEPMGEETYLYQGEMTKDYFPHGEGTLSKGINSITGKFYHGFVNDSDALVCIKGNIELSNILLSMELN